MTLLFKKNENFLIFSGLPPLKETGPKFTILFLID